MGFPGWRHSDVICWSRSLMTAALAILSRFPLLSTSSCSIYYRLMFFLPKHNTYQIFTVISFYFGILSLLQCVEQCTNLLLSVGGTLETHYMGNLVKAPSLAAVAYHRRRICHSAVSSPRWLKQEVTTLNTPTWQGSLVTDFLSVTPGDWERQSSRAPLKPIIEHAF